MIVNYKNAYEELKRLYELLEKENARLKEILIQNGVKQKMLLEDINKYAMNDLLILLKEN